MNCLTCPQGYYLIENTNNCQEYPYPGYYLEDDKLKKCYKNCLTCSTGPVTNSKGEVSNMNCDSCDESKGFSFVPGTKNCEINQTNYYDQCPEDKPILKDGKCVLDYCTKEDFDTKKCNISSPIIQKQWIGEFPYVSSMNGPLYSTFGQSSNEDIFFESNLGNPFTDRKIFTLNENGRGYIDGVPGQIINLNSNLYSTYGNGAIVKINKHKLYLRLSYHETIELYDFDEKKYTFAKLEDVLGYKVESHHNSLLRTNEENTFIFAYITTGYYLIMQKFKVVSNDASNCIQLIKTSLENVKTIPKNSRRCMITKKQFVECLDMDENQMYVVRVYDSNLNFLKQFELEKNKSPLNKAFYTYHEIMWIKEELSVIVYYKDTSDNNAKPLLNLKKLVVNENSTELIDASPHIGKEKLYNSLPYILSDSENSLALINEYYFALATITSYQSRHLLIILFNIFNEDNTINANYFDIPIKDLYDINYYGNLQAFGYRNTFGVQFDHKKGEEYRSGFIIFGYGNTTDPTPVSNLFNKQDSYIIKPIDYIKVDNNVFCYVLVNIQITELPEESTGVLVQRVSDSKTLRVGDIIAINDEIKITHSINKDDIPRGKYIVGFTPYLNEADEDDYYECMTDLEMIGEIVPTYWRPDEYYGRTSRFVFTAGDCFTNCKTCITKGSDINNQKCETCLENYYFVEGTKNCFENPPDGYYLDEEKGVFVKCHEKCKKCSKAKSGKYHNCLSCYEKYILYNNTNCLDCAYNNKYVNYEQTECIDKVPDGFFVNDTDNKTIDKCHPNCKKCIKASSDDNNMNCLTCDNDKGYYLVEGTNNCESYPLDGHYLENDTLKHCNISCATCSNKAEFNQEGQVTNCDTCNKDYGYYPDENDPKTCSNTADDGQYFDEDCHCYKDCHKNCLTCSTKEISDYQMNCLSCDAKEGFTYFPKTTNCLKCKSYNKYVNYEQTECIDKIPEGYYVNDSNINTIDKCYKDCKTCSAAGTSDNMNCILCQPSLYLKNGNCIKTYTCPYKFFYQIKIDKTANMLQKVCLDQNEICPCALPFYYTTTNECVESCPLELLLYQGCKISNLPYGLNMIINLVKLYFSQGVFDTFIRTFSLTDYLNLYNIAVKLSIYSLFSNSIFNFRQLETYQSLTDDNMTLVNDINEFEGSSIDLGKCESKLRQHYKIPNNVNLTIIKLDFKRNDSNVNNVQYEVFNPLNRSERLDLSICNEEKILVLNPIELKEQNKLEFIVNFNKYDFFSEESDFFTDECLAFTSEEGTDVTLQDRYNDYNLRNKLCQNGCEFNNYDSSNKKVECYCPPNKGFTDLSITDIEKIMKEVDNSDANNNNEETNYKNNYSGINGKLTKCAKNIFSSYFVQNYILIIFTLLLVIYIVLSVLYVIFKNKVWKAAFGDKKSSSGEKKGSEIDDKVQGSSSNTGRTLTRSTIQENKSIIDPHGMDSYEYTKAKEKDNRSLISMFVSSLFKREIVLFSFTNERNISIIKKLLLIFTLINYIATNTFFITEKNVHQIYLDHGKYNCGYQFKYIIASILLSSVFLYIAKYLCTIRKSSKDIYNSLELKIWILLGITAPLFIFYWIYIGSVTSVYINTNKHLLINIILTFIFASIFECLLALISASLRFFGLKKEKSLLYKMSQIINYL